MSVKSEDGHALGERLALDLLKLLLGEAFLQLEKLLGGPGLGQLLPQLLDLLLQLLDLLGAPAQRSDDVRKRIT